jgi:hypothetical protein
MKAHSMQDPGCITLLVACYRPHLVCCNSQSRAALFRHLRANTGQKQQAFMSNSKRSNKSEFSGSCTACCAGNSGHKPDIAAT